MFFTDAVLADQLPLRVLDRQTTSAADGFAFPRTVDLSLLPLTGGPGYGVARLATDEIRFTFVGQPDMSRDTRFGLAFARPGQALGAIMDLKRLDAMLGGRSTSPATIPATTQNRLRAALVGVDGHTAGRSYREIAIRIYGEDVVEQSWSDIDRVLKNRTVRAVQRGRRYVTGGYRKLLG